MEQNLINNTAWLAGYAAYERGEDCPWRNEGDESAWLGWVAAKRDRRGGR